MAGNLIDARVAAVRRFNRYYSSRMGLLRERLHQTPYSLTQARLLYELAHREDLTATDLCQELDLDPGYVSRLLKNFEKNDLLSRRPAPDDARRSHLTITKKGHTAFKPLEKASIQQVDEMLADLDEVDQRHLVDALETVERLLTSKSGDRPAYVLRPHQVGDMGWVVERHAVLYATEYGWDQQFEAMVAELVGAFIRNYQPDRERCWIAEIDGKRVGSVFLVEEDQKTARLRMLFIEGEARGHGIGRRLVEECTRFARQAGYTAMTLWTNDILHAARRIYEQAGFRLTASDAHHSFGQDLVGQTWDLDLDLNLANARQ
jgi:DNA-binding MarR family transcriptional regulator/GNAT superfamily N-acetyltransferase